MHIARRSVLKGGVRMKNIEDHMNTIVGGLLMKYVPEQANAMLAKVTSYLNTLTIGK